MKKDLRVIFVSLLKRVHDNEADICQLLFSIFYSEGILTTLVAAVMDKVISASFFFLLLCFTVDFKRSLVCFNSCYSLLPKVTDFLYCGGYIPFQMGNVCFCEHRAGG